MPPRTIEIKVDIISDPNGSAKAKRVVTDVEKEVLASHKRVAASSKATDRAISESQKQVNNAAKLNAKSHADKFIQELKRMESGAKTSSTSIQASLKSAFGGGLIGGAIGGFAGGIVAQFTSAISQLPSVFKNQLDEMVSIATERQNAFKGLETMSKFLGISAKDAQDTVKNLRLVKAGVVDIADASTSLKNLLSSGFSLPEANKLLEAFSDTAAFGKSAALDFGEAIRGATEGIRNGNSVLVDNVGLTKNLSAILKDAGFAETDLAKVKDDANVRQALYNGLLKEALPQMGDADRLTKSWTGSTAALTTAQDNLYAALGDVIIRNVELNALVKTLTGDMNDLTIQVKDTESGWSHSVDRMTSSFSNFIFTLTLDVQRGIANLRDLGNDLEWLYNRAASFATDLGTGWTSAGAARKQAADDAAARSNQNTRYFDSNVAPAARATFSGNVSAQRQTMFGNRSPFAANPFSSPFGVNNVAFPGMLGGGGPGTYAGGGPIARGATRGGGRPSALPRTKSSSVNLKLKDEMSDALEIAAKYGLLVTSGKDGQHNAGSAHYAGGAFDVRSSGVHPAVFEAAMRELQDAGYAVKDERSQPLGQKVWSGSHVHVGGRKTPKNRTFDPKATARVIGDWMPTDEQGREISTSGRIETDISGRDRVIDANEKEIEQNKTIIDLYEQLDESIFNVNERTEEEILLRKIKLGQYPGLTEGAKQELLNNARVLDDMRERNKAQEEQKQQLEDYRREQQRLFDDTARGFEDMLNDLASGNFKSIWDTMRRNMFDMFIKPASQYLAHLFTGQPIAAAGAGGGFGGGFGGIGIGGTPNFNPGNNFSGGGGGGGIGGILSGILGGGGASGGGGVANAPGSAGYVPGLTGSIPQLSPGGGGGGFGGLLRGMGGGSMTAGIGAGLGQIGAMAGAAIGGKWGNVLSFTGMGASIGAQVGGPWGAAIGAALGFGASMLQFLFKDNATKKLKDAALSTYGITVKDKSVLNALKQLGESMFGKGKVGANAQAVVSSDQGETILRNYAEATGQNTKMMDRLHFGDENWSGNQFRGTFSGFGAPPTSKVAGFRAMGGSVRAGQSYIVGEHRAEMFTPSQNGFVSPTVGGDVQTKIIMGRVEEVLTQLATRLESIPWGQALAMGAAENPNVIGDTMMSQASRQDVADAQARATGRVF